MECNEALILISGHIDSCNTPQEEDALQAHLATCPDCRALLQAYELIDKNVACLSVPAPDTLAPSIMAQIKPQPKQKKFRPWISVGTGAGLVAAVLVLLIGTNAIKLPRLTSTKTASTEKGIAGSLAIETAAPCLAEDFPEYADTDAKNEACMLPGGVSADTATGAYEGDGSDYGAKPTATSASVRHISAPINPKLLQGCTALSEENMAAVLVYSGIGTDFFSWLQDYAPALSKQFTASSETTVDEDTGIITVSTQYNTVAALHEWFRHVLLPEVSETVVEGDLLDEIRGQFDLYGLDGSHLEKIYTFPADSSVDNWPETMPEQFAAQWVSGENWRLLYPKDGYTPKDDDPAFLVLIPPAEEP